MKVTGERGSAEVDVAESAVGELLEQSKGERPVCRSGLCEHLLVGVEVGEDL